MTEKQVTLINFKGLIIGSEIIKVSNEELLIKDIKELSSQKHGSVQVLIKEPINKDVLSMTEMVEIMEKDGIVFTRFDNFAYIQMDNYAKTLGFIYGDNEYVRWTH